MNRKQRRIEKSQKQDETATPIIDKSHTPDDLLARGRELQSAGKFAEAQAIYQRLLASYPKHEGIMLLLGVTHAKQGNMEESIRLLKEAIAIKPDYADAYYNLGRALQDLKQHQEALTSYQHVLALDPRHVLARRNLGISQYHLGNYEDALASFDNAIALNPGYADAHHDRGAVKMRLGKYDEAFRCFDKAISLAPDSPRAWFHKGTLKLLLGEFEEGWRLYEWRWKDGRKVPLQDFQQPLWLGKEPLAGKTILLHAEQGLGDTIQLCRYIPLVASLGANVVVQVPASLLKLISTLEGSFQVVAKGHPLPDFDLHCPLFSLPLALKTTLTTIPANIPYLSADPAKRATWRKRLGEKVRPRIGLVWSGSIGHEDDHNRSIPLRLFLPLLASNCDFHSLQKEIRSEDALVLAQQNYVISHAENVKDFADTAALIAEMDLIISVDTSVAHLAGAMGKPVWILLPFAPDYRWMLEREDSPWYPSARLFRQKQIGDWESVIAKIVAELDIFFHLGRYNG